MKKTRQDILKEVYNYLRSEGRVHTRKEFSIFINADYTNLSSAFGGSEKYLTDGLFDKIHDKVPVINKEWLFTGEGEMLKQDNHSITTNTLQNTTNKKQIPLYDDVASIGGQHEMTSDMIGTTNPSDYIDAGDWFREATVAIRHYGKSMTEYPSGCILALKEVNDRRLLIPGRDYVIETDEYRVTKKIQVMDTYIRAHSTNTDKYDDGTLIYQPFDVPLEAIRRMFIVLGYVVKKSGGTLLYNK